MEKGIKDLNDKR